MCADQHTLANICIIGKAEEEVKEKTKKELKYIIFSVKRIYDIFPAVEVTMFTKLEI